MFFPSLLIPFSVLILHSSESAVSGNIIASSYLSEKVASREKTLLGAARRFLGLFDTLDGNLLDFKRFTDGIRLSNKHPRKKNPNSYDSFYFPLNTYFSLRRLATKWPDFIAKFSENNTLKDNDYYPVMRQYFRNHGNGSWYHPHISEHQLEELERALVRIQVVYEVNWENLGKDLNEDEVAEFMAKTERRQLADYIKPCQYRKPMDLKPWHRCRYKTKFVPYLRAKVEILHTNPSIEIYHNMLTKKQRIEIMDIASMGLHVSKVRVPKDKTKSGTKENLGNRLSSQTWLNATQYESVSRIYKAISLWTGYDTELRTKNSSVETFQVVNYALGGLFNAHYDYYDESKRGPTTQNSALEYSGQRFTTWMFYLTVPPLGGDTIFPELGYKVRPEIGSALVWDNLKLDGDFEPLSLHAGCPVALGHKWIGNVWLRSHGQMFAKKCPKNFHKTNLIKTPR